MALYKMARATHDSAARTSWLTANRAIRKLHPASIQKLQDQPKVLLVHLECIQKVFSLRHQEIAQLRRFSRAAIRERQMLQRHRFVCRYNDETEPVVAVVLLDMHMDVLNINVLENS